MEWSAQHLSPTTRDRTQERGGREPRHRRFIIEHVNKKGLSGPNMGKSIRSECVIQILSRSQKHEQVLKFPTHILSAQSGRVTTHKWFDAAWGPATQAGARGNYLFIAPVALARWLSLSFLPRLARRVQGPVRGPSVPGKHTFVRKGPQSTQQQAICLVGLLPASNLSHKLSGCIKRTSSAALLRLRPYRAFCEKEALVGCLSVSTSTHVRFPSPQTTVIAEIILH